MKRRCLKRFLLIVYLALLPCLLTGCFIIDWFSGDENWAGEIGARVEAMGIDRYDGSLHDIAYLEVKEMNSPYMIPLVPIIYFESNTAEIPSRYHLLSSAADAASYKLPSYSKPDPLSAYYEILNVIGQRMTQQPSATLHILGCNDGQEEGGIALSRSRAESVRDYLTSIWSVAAARLTVDARNLPANESKTSSRNARDIQDAREENRRVELSSESLRIIEPIAMNQIYKTLQYPTIQFHFGETVFRDSISAKNDSIKDWELRISIEDESIRTIRMPGKPLQHVPYDWNLQDDYESIPEHDVAIRYELTVRDHRNVHGRDSGTIPLKYYTLSEKTPTQFLDNFKIYRYHLNVFGFGEKELDPYNRKIFEYIISKEADFTLANADIFVYGYTDRIGSEEYNKNLSQKRADNVAERLKKHHNKMKIIAKGFGEPDPDFPKIDNSVPEGRSYSRTVVIEVWDPIVVQ